MLVSLEWLNEYVDISDLKPEIIAEALTMSGLEVEEIEYIKPKFSNVFTGKILDIKPHPDAEKLQLATVDYGSGTQQVVCGARNIAVGQTIPFALEGAKVFNRKTGEEFILKKTKIRGVESSGMICSTDELGLEDEEFNSSSDGILVLSNLEQFKSVDTGIPIEKLLNLQEDVVLHTAPTANRGDLMSMRGVAHEVAAIFNRNIKPFSLDIDENTAQSNESFKVNIDDLDTCTYYSIGIIKDVKFKKSPDWMGKRLKASGMRPINNIVDITNYVMLEYGQPLHAFDLKKLEERTLSVRRAKAGEKITTLDGLERELDPENVLIAAPNRAVAIGGVMGDESSEVDETTTDLALESAYFTPATNRRSSRKVGLRTEACARFERGVDIKTVKLALKRTMQLLIELADGKTAGVFEAGKDELTPIKIKLRYTQIKRILGIDVPVDNVIQILQNLGFKLLNNSQVEAEFEVPSYRVCDVQREIDLIEEISRIYGYQKIIDRIPAKTSIINLSIEENIYSEIKTLLRADGLNEIVTSSLVGYPLLEWCSIPAIEDKAIKVTNPQSEEYTMLRLSMIPSILQVVKYNIDRDIKDVWIFEIGKTYFITHEPTQKDPGTTEKILLAGAITGDILKGSWHSKRNVDFYYLKGIIENIVEYFDLSKRIEFLSAQDIDYMHPGRTAYINILGKKQESNNFDSPYAGYFGQLHPEQTSRCKLNQPVFIFELDLSKIIKTIKFTDKKYKSVPQFPSVSRDVAFVIDECTDYQTIIKSIKKASSELLDQTEIFDVYKGENIEPGKRSLAFRLTFTDKTATLTDEIVEKEVEKIKTNLVNQFKVNLRQ